MESCDLPPPPPTPPALGDDQLISLSPSVADPVEESSSKLPKHIVLKSRVTGRYLRYMVGTSDEQKYGSHYISHLEFTADNNTGPTVKFEVVPKGKFISIKSCYNNKYWDCHEQKNYSHVTATATKPVEDTDSVNCTLFEPMYGNIDAAGNKNMRLRRAGTQKFLQAQNNSLLIYSDDDGFGDELTVIDWETVVVLPKRLVFKGQNGKYLKAYTHSSTNYMAFQSEKVDYELEANEITQTPDGTVSIRNEHLDKFWRLNTDNNKEWVYVDGDSSRTVGVYFKPVLLETNTKIALQSLYNNKFSTYSTTDSTCYLRASSNVINENAHMTIEEPVVSRVIDNVKFRKMDARKIDETPAFADSDHIINTTDHPKTKFTKVITLADTNSSTWDNISSVKLEVSTTLNAGVPIIVDGEIQVSAEIAESYKWGGVYKEETEVGGKLTANVPPYSKLTVNLTYTKGTCEVPFTYVQHDTLTNGVLETTEMDCGIYTGTNCYNFTFETVQTPL